MNSLITIAQLKAACEKIKNNIGSGGITEIEVGNGLEKTEVNKKVTINLSSVSQNLITQEGNDILILDGGRCFIYR